MKKKELRTKDNILQRKRVAFTANSSSLVSASNVVVVFIVPNGRESDEIKP
jgi:hypothetical protein